MKIKYKNYSLRNVTLDDSVCLANWWNDGTIMAHTGNPLGLGVKLVDVHHQLYVDILEKYHRLIIEFQGKAIGECYYKELDSVTAKIGIRICDFSLHDKGMGRIILSMLISHLFNSLKFTTITVTTNLTNTRAQHVYEKLGFKKIRIDYNCEKNQMGELQSLVVYSMTIEDFISFIN